MPKVSVRAAARDARTAEAKEVRAREKLLGGTSGRTIDSFVNFAQKAGVGADNALSTARYGFNPTTRNRILLEWMHRGAWLAGLAVDIPADDMTRAGVEFATEIEPEDAQAIERLATTLGVWDKLGDTVRWGRLYGGAIGVMLIDGQDLRTPLRKETVGPDQFKGLVVLDRWMLQPELGDLVTDFGPDLGLPKYYRVMENAPALKNTVVHYSRVALRHVGIELPYHQALTENLWGLSVLERLYDRMVMFDGASTGAGQLVYKAFLRTLKVKDLRSIVAAGNTAMAGLTSYVQNMRLFQNNEGVTMIDAEDEFDVQTHGAFSGLAEVVQMFAGHVAGALQIPMTRLLGQSPGGLNATGESDLRTYYDYIAQQQRRLMHRGVNTVYELLARSRGVEVPDDFSVDFATLWQLDDSEKSDIAQKTQQTVQGAYDGGLISQAGAMRELRQSSRTTGVFTNITAEDIDAADDQVSPPGADELDPSEPSPDLSASQEHDAAQADLDRKHELTKQRLDQQHDLRKTKLTLQAKKQEARNAARSNGQARSVGGGARKRNRI